MLLVGIGDYRFVNLSITNFYSPLTPYSVALKGKNEIYNETIRNATFSMRNTTQLVKEHWRFRRIPSDPNTLEYTRSKHGL
jgi:hypothetical protein